MARDYKKIKAWKFSDDLAVEIYSSTKAFPKEELYGITSQLRRAAVSVPTNIAEGASRVHQKEYFQFLNIAIGSIAEVEYLLHLANRLDYLDNGNYKRLEGLRAEAGRTLYGLINAVKNEV